MIRVARQPEYPDFDTQVRQRGLRFLASCANPTARQFARHNYWNQALAELYAAYRGTCAYTSRRLVSTGSVDHYRPKSKYPHLAYEWDNYRFCRQAVNNRKGDSEDVIDPFAVQNGWFTLDLPSCLIKANKHVSRAVRVAINNTVNVLGLNRDERLVQERCDLLVALADGKITLEYLDDHYPFLAFEVRRQRVLESLKEVFARS